MSRATGSYWPKPVRRCPSSRRRAAFTRNGGPGGPTWKPPTRSPIRFFRIEQNGADLTGHAWALEEGQQPAGLETDQAGWRFAGTAGETAITIAVTEANTDGEWAAYPYVAIEVPAAIFLEGKCPEYGDRVLQTVAVSTEAEITLQDDGSMTGTLVSILDWKIGEETWTETHGPTSFTATRLEE